MNRFQRLLAALLIGVVPLIGTQALAGEGAGKANGHGKKDSGVVVVEPEPTPTTEPENAEQQDPDGPADSTGSDNGPQGDPNDPAGDPGGEPGPPQLEVGAHAKELLVQVGDEINYTVTVGNPGDAPLEEVIVLDIVPAEIDVLGVADNPEVEAIQLGQHNGQEDIVWNVGTLDAGETLELGWIGVAAKAGDLEAVNSVRATALQVTSETEGTSYLGALEDRDVRNPAFEPIKKKVVSYSRPRITKVLPAPPTTAGAVLPFTGSEPIPWLVLGLSLIAAGAAALLLVKLGPARQHVVVLAAVALLLTACVSDQKSPSDDQARAPSDSSVVESDDDDEEEGDVVLGTRLEKDEDKDKDETEADGTDVLPVEPVTQVVTVLGDPVRTVETVELTLADLETEDVESRDGDNHLTYEWDADSTSIVNAASSRMLVRGQTLELLTSVSDDDGDIDIVVTLTNLADEKRARIHGRLIHKVFDSTGLIATFESPLIDTVLDPGGETTATFTYMLPDGSYSAEGSFQAA
jgi:uncharacterized repeat protein (TIGR01451 family)